MAVFAIALHILATILVFVLGKRFIQNNLLAFLGALFFAVNAVSHESITWAFVAISTVGGSILVLFSIFAFFRYLSDARQKWLLLTGLFIYISLWFKEIGLYLFLFFPLAALFFKRYTFRTFLTTFWIMIVPFLMIVGYRIVELRFRTTESNLYITGLNENFFSTILLRTILYPLTSFSLMFVPGDHFLSFSRFVLRQVYPFLAKSANNMLVAQSVVLDLLSIVLTVLLLLIIYFFLKKEKKSYKNFVLFWLSFALMGFLPYVLLGKDFSYLESRYYYLSVAGGAMLFAWILKRLADISGKKIFFLVIMPLCILYIQLHASVVRAKIEAQITLSNMRRNFMTQLNKFAPTLNEKKNVFYISGSQNFWADGNKIPFQQGTGYTLMVLYFRTGKIPKELLKEGFLFDIGSQGYKEVGEYGFGYFWDESKLEKTLRQNKLQPIAVVRLYYDSFQRRLTDL
jgi:hypothetical protein